MLADHMQADQTYRPQKNHSERQTTYLSFHMQVAETTHPKQQISIPNPHAHAIGLPVVGRPSRAAWAIPAARHASDIMRHPPMSPSYPTNSSTCPPSTLEMIASPSTKVNLLFSINSGLLQPLFTLPQALPTSTSPFLNKYK